MDVSFFSSLVDEAVRKAGGQRALAKELGVGLATVSAWCGEGLPRLDSFILLLKYVGGDIDRALPDWEAEHGEAPPAGMVIGRVAAGTARFTAGDDRPVALSPQNFLRSRWYPFTRAPQSGRRVEWVQVDGDSMEPDFPHGALLACRPPRDPRELGDGVHAIIRNAAGDMTFKALHFRGTGRNREVVAVPLNRSHALQFWPASEVEIDWVILGMIQLRVLDGPAFPMLSETGEIPPLPKVIIGDGSDDEETPEEKAKHESHERDTNILIDHHYPPHTKNRTKEG